MRLCELTSPHLRSTHWLTERAPPVMVVVLGGHCQHLLPPQSDCQVPGLQTSHRPPPASPPARHLHSLPGGQAELARQSLLCSAVPPLTNTETPGQQTNKQAFSPLLPGHSLRQTNTLLPRLEVNLLNLKSWTKEKSFLRLLTEYFSVRS